MNDRGQMDTDYAPPTRSLNSRRRPWRYRPDPLLDDIAEVRPSGPSIRSASGSIGIGHHILEASQVPRPSRRWRWFSRFLAVALIVLVVVVAWSTF